MIIRVPAGQSITHIFDDAIDTQSELVFELERDSSLELFVVVRGTIPKLSISVSLQGENAHARIRGVYILEHNEAVLIETRQIHQAPHTVSDCSIKGILYDTSFAEYHGAIYVDPQAHHTQAAQSNKNILLSSSARAISIPSLEVLTKQVKCAHGSAVGTIDPEILFYAQSRGLGADQAQKIVLQGFVGEILDSMPERLVREVQDLIR